MAALKTHPVVPSCGGDRGRRELEAGEVLFTIPRTALLSQHTTSIHALLEEGECKLLVSLESALPFKGINESVVKPRERF